MDCARSLRIWILVRKTNDASLPYIAKPGFIPRPTDCQAKTADSGPLAGLVVNPELVPKAFSPNRLSEARDAWREFRLSTSLTEKYRLDNDPNSDYYGCALYQGDYIHADYDLFDVILSRRAEGSLAFGGQPGARNLSKAPVVSQIQRFVNPKIGSPMIRRWGETRGVDMAEQEISVFGPMGQTRTLRTEDDIDSFYLEELQRPRPFGAQACATHACAFRSRTELRLMK